MIVCHCLNITDRDIDAAIDWMRAAYPDVLITAGKIYRALGKSADCGGCLPLFLTRMRSNPQFPVPGVDRVALRADMDATMIALAGIKTAAEAGTAYDQMLAPGNTAGEALVQTAIDALVAQTRNIERAVEVIGLAQFDA